MLGDLEFKGELDRSHHGHYLEYFSACWNMSENLSLHFFDVVSISFHLLFFHFSFLKCNIKLVLVHFWKKFVLGTVGNFTRIWACFWPYLIPRIGCKSFVLKFCRVWGYLFTSNWCGSIFKENSHWA